jgi:hypothetical protein
MNINKYNKVTPPSSARVKNEWSYTSATPVCLCDMDGDSYVIKEGEVGGNIRTPWQGQLSVH